MIAEKTEKLPNLVLPKFRDRSAPVQYLKGPLFILEPDRNGWLTIHRDNGESFKLVASKDIVKLFPDKYNWVFSKGKEFDCLFKVFTSMQLGDLKWTTNLDLPEGTLHYIFGTAKIVFRVGNVYRYLINVGPFCSKNFKVKDFKDLELAVTKFIEASDTLEINSLSFGSTVKDIVLRDHNPEFRIIRSLSQDDLQFLHDAYPGPRMETTTLGTIDNTETLDQRKAYLRALSKCPSLDKQRTIIDRNSNKYYKGAHPGSAYLIQANVPRTYKDFPLLPLRTSFGRGYPWGEIVVSVSKPYLDLLEEVKDIPYKILKCLQFIPMRDDRPFEDLCTNIEYFEDRYKEELYPINVKGFHFTMQGHFMSWYPVLDNKGDTTFKASEDYNPILANAMQSLVAKDLWVLSQTQDVYSIRVDGASGRRLRGDDNYKHSEPHLSTLLNPYLKDLNGSKKYRDLIYENRDSDSIKLTVEGRISLNQGILRPETIGKLIKKDLKIPASPGNRIVHTSKLTRLGILLESTIPTVVPSAEELSQGGFKSWIEPENLEWILESQDCSPETQT